LPAEPEETKLPGDAYDLQLTVASVGSVVCFGFTRLFIGVAGREVKPSIQPLCHAADFRQLDGTVWRVWLLGVSSNRKWLNGFEGSLCGYSERAEPNLGHARTGVSGSFPAAALIAAESGRLRRFQRLSEFTATLASQGFLLAQSSES
jgi:hypothetical protein